MATASEFSSDPSPDVRQEVATKLRLLGFLPLAFFIAHLSFYWRNGGMENMFWMCNVANLALAAGLFLGLQRLIRIAVLWLIPGLPLWLYYVTVNGGWLVTSFFTHIGGLIVGLFVLYKIGAGRWMWLHGFVLFLIVQQASRSLTRPESNVNIAHVVDPAWAGVFSSYGLYWMATTLTVAAVLWVLGLILLKIFPSDGVLKRPQRHEDTKEHKAVNHSNY